MTRIFTHDDKPHTHPIVFDASVRDDHAHDAEFVAWRTAARAQIASAGGGSAEDASLAALRTGGAESDAYLAALEAAGARITAEGARRKAEAAAGTAPDQSTPIGRAENLLRPGYLPTSADMTLMRADLSSTLGTPDYDVIRGIYNTCAKALGVEPIGAQVGDTDDGLGDLADRLGKPAAALSGRALAMARTKNGGVNPAGSQPEIDASKLTGRALHMHQLKQGGAR